MRLYPIKTPYLVKKLYPNYIWSFTTNTKEIYLTFDDGPIPEVTEFVLAELKKYDAKATFFCIGENVQKHPDIFVKIVSEKHHIGNHTFNHLHAQKVSKATYIANVLEAEKTIHAHSKQITNTEKLFRPPYGIIKTSYAKELREKGYTIVMWDVISADFDPRVSPEKCLRNVQQNTRKGSVVVFHDSIKAKQNLYYTLPKVIEAYAREGYSFKGLGARNTAVLNQ